MPLQDFTSNIIYITTLDMTNKEANYLRGGGGGEFFLKKDMYDNDMRGCKKKLKKKGKRGRKQNLELERERW